MIDYKKAAEDKVLGWFWNADETDAVLGLLVDYYDNKQVSFYRLCKKKL